MKYVRFKIDEEVKYGIIKGEQVWLLTHSFLEDYEVTNQSYLLSEVTPLSPTLPSKAVCVGLNYADHAMEMNIPIPSTPILFMKPSSSTIGPDEAIVHPTLSKRVDYEGELAIVIKKEAYQVPLEEVGEYILGYTCANDVTARDLQKSDGQWTVAKGFDTFMPLGPIVSDEVDPTILSIKTSLNGKVVQQSNTKHLIFSAHYLVSYISSIMTLYPGDVILTGTPGGIGKMEIGDKVTVEIEGIGSLTNTLHL
ncbi:MAG: DUF2437 domain-containing protein [Spirochaetia bacterium]|nr:DUF2437 domain-containing protein [Spirochaetia bacterium]